MIAHVICVLCCAALRCAVLCLGAWQADKVELESAVVEETRQQGRSRRGEVGADTDGTEVAVSLK